MAKAAPKRKAANGYKLAERFPKGEILEDIAKKKWKLGTSIGQGGFGEIYEAQEVGSSGSNYPYVIKIEPHTNGPLFVEMHFYMRNAKPADVEEFKKERRLKTFGMPLYLGSGSHEFKNEKYRFIVTEKFGTDIWKIFLENKKTFPTDTVFKLGVQILDVLEYIHKRGYVHADIKGANILMGLIKGTTNQVYLLDFGLATKFTTEKEFKPNPKKAHDGTIEYLSRDAHKGVQTRRGDLEILAYNLIQWLGCTLPWENNLKDPNVVHNSKEEYMSNVPKMIKACFGHKTPPGAVVDFLNYLKTLKFNDDPDYKKIRKIFISGIKDAGGSESSPLNFKLTKTPQKRKSEQRASPSPKRKVGRGKKVKKALKVDEIENLDEDDDKEELTKPITNSDQSDVDDEDIVDASYEEEPKVKATRGLKEKNKSTKKTTNPKKVTNENSESDKAQDSKKTNKKNDVETEQTDGGQNGTVDPYEGYTDAMREIMKKKLQKSKGRKKNKEPLEDDNMDGYTESMKEIALKKKEKLSTKRTGKKVTSSSTDVSEPMGRTRGSRLRACKEIYYDDPSDSE